MTSEIAYHLLGIAFLALAKAKYAVRGYSTPKPFDMSDIDRCIQYDINTVNGWMKHLPPLDGKHVLELGPGSDLGTGLYMLSKGAATYTACDINDLERHTPYVFYERLLDQLQAEDWLRRELEIFKAGYSSRIRYFANKAFKIAPAVADGSIDIVVSQSAFEHFDNVKETAEQLTLACKRGAHATIQVDLKTHSRWIRDKDPLNIYRYSDRLYRAFYFPGQPNRMRPHEYKNIFEDLGWNVRITATQEVGVMPRMLHHRFLSEKSRAEMAYSSIMISADR